MNQADITTAPQGSSGNHNPTLLPLLSCWICGDRTLERMNEELFDMTWQVDPIITRYHGAKFWLVRCARCGFMQPEALPNESDFFDRLYSKDRGSEWMEAEFTSPYKDLIFCGILRSLAARLPVDRRTLVDVGTHVGRMPYLAARRGWSVEGIELNAHIAAFAAERTGLPIHQLSAQQLAEEGRSFDAVTLIDVLEHIPEPMTILRELKHLVRPGGWLSIKVPCGRNQLLKERIRRRLGQAADVAIATNLVHVNHFTPKSLRAALVQAGFGSIELSTAAPELPTWSYRLRALAARFGRLGVYYAARLFPGGVNTPLAMNLQAFARRER